MFGCNDENMFLQHNGNTNDLEILITARLSMVDFTKEIKLQKAQRICNTNNSKEFLNDAL